MTGARDTIIIAHGHLYLFWTTGVYYTNELANKYNVVLVVPEEYRDDPRFTDICKKMGIKAIVYFKDSIYFARKGYIGQYKTNILRRHIHYSTLFKKTVQKYKPICVVQHDYIGIDNMYLFHWAGKLVKNCKKIVILSSNSSDDNTMSGLSAFRVSNIKKIARKYYLPEKLLSYVVKGYKYAQSYIQNKLVPTILLGEKPYFPVSIFSNIDIIPKKPLFDYFLVYAECEKKYLESLLNVTGPIQTIQSPVADRYNINDSIYTVKEENIVLFLPSLIALRPLSEEKETISKWIIALNLLRNQFPEYQFIMKFHPGNTSDALEQLKNYLKKKCIFLSFMESKVRAEELILKSKIIVGDVSTTLWWANLKGNKLVISLDMKDYPTSGIMKRYPNILYYENINQIAEIDLAGAQKIKSTGEGKIVSMNSSLMGFIEKVTKK